MKLESNYFNEISSVKNKILNYSLLIGLVLGSIILVFAAQTESNLPNVLGLITDFIILVVLGITYLFRKKTTVYFRTHVLLVTIILFVVLDIFRHGPFSDNQIFILLIPFFLRFIYSIRYTVIVFIIISIGYSIIAFCFVHKILTPQISQIPRIVEPSVWIVKYLLIVMIAIIIVTVNQLFESLFLSLISNLKIQNQDLVTYKTTLEQRVAEKTKDLEKINNMLFEKNDRLRVTTDILHRKNSDLEDTLLELNKAQMQLVQSEKMASLGVLSAGVAHEINNPLNFIMGAYTGLQNYFETVIPEKKKDVEMLLESLQLGIERSSNIVNGLNQFARNNDSFSEKCNVHDILTNCIHILQGKLESTIQIEKSFSSNSSEVIGNVGKLHQAFVNILSNAIDALSGKGIIRIEVLDHVNSIQVSITDNGCGIPKEILDKVTDPFFTTKSPGLGTGLGLSIVHELIKQHGGTVEIVSTEHIGTKVTIVLPKK